MFLTRFIRFVKKKIEIPPKYKENKNKQKKAKNVKQQ